MNVNTKQLIENLGNSIFANLGNICMIIFLYFWASNNSHTEICNELNVPIILIITFSIMQIITRSFFLKKQSVIEQFLYLGIIGTWVFVLILVWTSNLVDLIIILNFTFISLILINALLPNNFQLLNSIFFLSILFLSTFFSFSTTFFELKLAGSLTASLCLFSLILSLIIFKQFQRREKSVKRLDLLLKDLINKRKEIEQKGLQHSQFLASISHDLKQPMHAINLYLGSLETILLNIKMKDIQANKSFKSLQKLKQSVHYMNNVLDGLLEVSRLEQGVSKTQLSTLKVNLFFKKIINQHIKTTKELGLRLEFFSNLKNETTITSDFRLLERIFRNLLSNAIKYTKKGGIRVRVKEEFNVIKLSIIDTGPGIHPSMRKKIFNEFTQIDYSHYKRGIGLGLAIVKKLAGKIGAYINLKSHLGLGSIFILCLPKTSSYNSKKSCIVENENLYNVLPQVTTTDASETIVLVVDQDDDTRNAIEILSPNFGIDVVTGNSSKDIISKTSNLPSIPKIIIVDGSDLIEEPLTTIDNIQEEFNKEIPVIFITDDIENESLLIKSNQKVTLLQKPFSTSKLHQLIQSILSQPL